MIKVKTILLTAAVLLSAFLFLPLYVQAENTNDTDTVSGCNLDPDTPVNDGDTEDTTETSDKIQLIDPEDPRFAFYRGNGFNFSQEDALSYIETVLGEFIGSWVYFYTKDYDEFYDIQYRLDTSGILAGTPGHYTAVAEISLSEPDKYILPDGFDTISIPVHIRNSSNLEIYLESPGPMFSGSVYLPSDMEVSDGYLPAWYCYCGTDKPSVNTLDSLTFTQDEDIAAPFFYADYYGGSSGSLGIDFYEIPDEEGWYAFYVVANGIYSNYILIDSRNLDIGAGYFEGTRNGDTNSDFPDVDDDPTEDEDDTDDNDPDDQEKDDEDTNNSEDNEEDDSNGTDDDDDKASRNDGNSDDADKVSPVSTAPATGTTIIPAAETPLKEPSVEHTLREQDNADGTTVSGKRIRALIDAGSAFVISKNNMTACFSTESLKALGIGDNDFFTVTLTWSSNDTFCLSALINNQQIEILPEVLISFQDILYAPDRKQLISDSLGREFSCQDSNGRLAFITTSTGTYTITDEPLSKSQQEVVSSDTSEVPLIDEPASLSLENTPSLEPKASVFIVIAVFTAAAVLSGAVLFIWHWRKRKCD